MRRILSFLDTFRKVQPKGYVNNVTTGNSVNLNSAVKDLTDNSSVLDEQNTSLMGGDMYWQNLKRGLLLSNGQREMPRLGYDEFTMNGAVVDVLETQRFVRDVFVAIGVPNEPAEEMADVLIAADYMGHHHMGIHRLPSIANDLLNSDVDVEKKPRVISEREALALVDGQNAPGPVVGNFCMNLAITKARNQGIGYVAARRSNALGMTSWYACQALSQRMIGLCLSNGPPMLVPSGGLEPLLGDNSIACAAGSQQEQFIADLRTSVLSLEKIDFECSNGSLYSLPKNVALDYDGCPTTHAARAIRAQRLRPFDPEHKGFGLAAMVDVLCGVMTGARYATQVRGRDLANTGREEFDLGQVFIAIDPLRFCVSFEERLADFQKLLSNVIPRDATQLSYIPGQKELRHMQRVDCQGGLTLTPKTICMLGDLGERFHVDRIRARQV